MENPVKKIESKVRHYTSRKFIAYIITSGMLVIAALIVKNGNFPALSIGLVSTMSAFAVSNTAAGYIGSKQLPITTTTTTEQAD